MSASHRATTALLASIAFAARMAFWHAWRPPPAWDAVLYERAARGLASGLGYSCFMFGPAADPRVPTAYYPVGYPAYLAVFYALVGVAPWVVALAGATAGAASVAAVHRLALTVARPMVALLAGLALALMPGQIVYATVPMTEVLWGASLLACVASLDARRPWTAVAVAAASFVRPQALPLALALPLLRPGPWRRRVLGAAATVAMTLALVAPWTVRNCVSLDGCALVSANGASNLAAGTVARSDGTWVALTPDDGCRGVVGEAARERCWRAVALRNIRANPWAWAARAWPKLRHTFAYEESPVEYLAAAVPSRIDGAARERWHRRMTFAWQAVALLAALSVLTRIVRREASRAHLACGLTVLVVGATHAVFFGGDRYHLPLVGCACVMAAAVLEDGLRAVARMRAELSRRTR